MKNKIILIFTFVFLLILTSCDNEMVNKYKVTFKYEDQILHIEEVYKNRRVNNYNDERVKLWTLNDEPFDFDKPIISDLILIGIGYDNLTISFYINENLYDDITIRENELIPYFEPEALDNKIFEGWYANNDYFNFNKPVNEPVDVYANFVDSEHMISLSDGTVYYVAHGETLGIDKELTKQGEEFIGWFNDKYLYTSDTKVYNDLSLEPKFRLPLVNNSKESFDIYHLNDTHGAVLNDSSAKTPQLGLSRIGNYIKENKKRNPYASLFLVSGDMFQGQLISNANKGAVMIDIFNDLDLDSMTLGNHEFDWGLDVILKYFNPNYLGQKADFPVLGANVKEKETNERPDFVDAYTIVEKNGYKVGIIGVIGDGLESSILYERVKDYYFSDSYQAVLETYNQIKDKVDFVLVSAHASDQNFNKKVANLPKVDAVFNGHSHSGYTGFLQGNHPYIQSRSYGEAVGIINLNYQVDNNVLNFVNGSANNINNHAHLEKADAEIENIIQKYYKSVAHLYEEVIIKAKYSMSQDDLARYIARLMREATNSIAGFQNSGGTRASITGGQNITAADLFKIFPFDNKIIVVKITGSNLKKMLNDSYFFKDYNININEIVDSEYYQIATNDYIYYSNFNKGIFNGTKPLIFGDMYETFYKVMLNLNKSGYKEFDLDTPIIY